VDQSITINASAIVDVLWSCVELWPTAEQTKFVANRADPTQVEILTGHCWVQKASILPSDQDDCGRIAVRLVSSWGMNIEISYVEGGTTTVQILASGYFDWLLRELTVTVPPDVIEFADVILGVITCKKTWTEPKEDDDDDSCLKSNE
jgi:hypothetical protein